MWKYKHEVAYVRLAFFYTRFEILVNYESGNTLVQVANTFDRILACQKTLHSYYRDNKQSRGGKSCGLENYRTVRLNLVGPNPNPTYQERNSQTERKLDMLHFKPEYNTSMLMAHYNMG